VTVTTGAYNQNGNITVTAGNSCGTSSARTLAVTVNPGTPATPGVITGTAVQCPGLTLQTYSISSVTNATTYTWTVPTGWSITGGQGTTTVTVTTGAYNQNGNITVTAGNSCGTSTVRTLAVTVNPGTPAQPGAITGTAAQCPGVTLQAYSISSVTNATTYTWTVPTGWTITGGQGTSSITVTTGTAGQNGNISVTAGNSCGTSTARSLAVTVDAIPSSPVLSLTQTTCSSSTGTITVLSPTGTGMTYSINGTTYTNTTGVFSGVVAGTYPVTARSQAGCTSSGTPATINTQPVTPSAPIVGTITGPTCTLSTGSVVLSGLPSTGTWTLVRSPGGTTISGTGTSTLVSSIPSGETYTFSVTNSQGCSSLSSSAVVIPSQPVTPTAPVVGTITPPTCLLSTGSVTLSGLPSTGTWTLTRYPGTITTSGSGANTVLSGLPVGTYNYTVTTDAGCTSLLSLNVIIPDQPITPAIPVTGSIVQPTCSVSTGSVTLSGLPSTGTWSIIRTPGGITTSGSGTSRVISGLPAGTHTFTVTNSDGCTSGSSANVVINTQPATPTAPLTGTITQPTCVSATGSVVLTGLPSTGTWTLTRLPGTVTTSGTGTSTTVSGIAEGSYTYTVTNTSGCTSPASSAIIINAQPASPATPAQNVDCSLGFGNASVTVLSPVGAGLEYRLNSGTYQSATTFAGVANGNYTITVRNLSGCTTTGSTFNINCGCVNPPSLTPGSLTGSVCGTTPITVTGNTFGGSATSVTITENGTGTVSTATVNSSPFSFTYTPGAGDPGNTVTITLTTNNPLGSPCAAATATYLLTVNVKPSAPSVGTITHPTCLLSTGSVILSGLPSTGTWTITRSPGGETVSGTGTSTSVSGLATGTHTFTVTNSNGCTSTASSNVVINNQPVTPSAPLAGTITQPTCATATGSVILTGLPSTGTWTLTRSPGGVVTSGSGSSITISGLSSGTYNYTVTNSVGCISSLSQDIVIISQPLTPSAPSIGSIVHPTCSESTGSVTLLGLPDTGIWTLVRTPGGNTTTGTGTSTTITGLVSGTYSYRVTNTVGCTSLSSGNIVINSQPPTPSAPVAGTITQPTCNVSTGTVILGGLPSSGSWIITTLPGSLTTAGTGTSKSISGLISGTYNFTVTNSFGCVSVSSADVVINVQPAIPPAPVLDNITQPSCNSATGNVLLTGLPSSGPWTLTRFPGSVNIAGSGASFTVNDLPSGTYNFTVTNSSGCISTASANLVVNTQPPIPSTPSIGTITQTTCTITTGSVIIGGLPANGAWLLESSPATSIRSGSGATTTVAELEPGTYTFRVTNSYGCISLSTSQVIVNPQPATTPNLIITDPEPLCYPAVADLTLASVTDGSSTGLVYTYWTNESAASPLADPNAAVKGTYYIKGTSTLGCYTVKPVTVEVLQKPLVDAGEDIVLEYLFEVKLEGNQLLTGETGLWTVISGSAEFTDPEDPETFVHDLILGENRVQWTVTNGVCSPESDVLTITVNNLVIPTLITPNMDGKNDYFVLRGIETLGKTELIIFDRRGLQVYKNLEYDNSWNGVDNNESPLPDDTYFYTIKAKNGKSLSGYVLIRR
jgi:gliding motility-associated-like protein